MYDQILLTKHPHFSERWLWAPQLNFLNSWEPQDKWQNSSYTFPKKRTVLTLLVDAVP
jgi:hypothetical protein